MKNVPSANLTLINELLACDGAVVLEEVDIERFRHVAVVWQAVHGEPYIQVLQPLGTTVLLHQSHDYLGNEIILVVTFYLKVH